MPPAARVTDMHTCPMTTGPVPHVGGPILPPGVPTVLIGMLPAATVTNMATCVGPPDMIVMGSMGVFINFLPAARMGDQTAHGGVIVLGEPTVLVGEIGAPSPGAGGMAGVIAGLVATGQGNAIAAVMSMLATGASPGAAGSTMPPPGPVSLTTAEVVNAAMVANSQQPAWEPGTPVAVEVLPAGAKAQMVVSPSQARAVMRGKKAFGAFASPDKVPDQGFARNKLVILEKFKQHVSRVIVVETTAPQMILRGSTGPLGAYEGGAAQMQFLGVRNLKLSGQPRKLRA